VKPAAPTRTGPAWLALAAICVAAALISGAWLAQHPHAYGGQDEAHHYLRGLLVHDAAADRHERLFNEDRHEWPAWWPPLTYAVGAATMAALGREQWALTAAGTVFWLALIGFAFGIARRERGPWTGVAAAALVAAWPLLAAQGRLFNLDLALAAAAAGAMYFLLASEGLTRRGPTLAFGALCGLGLLAKVTFPVFVLPPLAVVLWQHRRELTARRFAWLAGAALLAAAVAGFWYAPRLMRVGHALLLHVVGYNRTFAPGQAESGQFFLVDATARLGLLGVTLVVAGLTSWPVWRRRAWAPVWAWLTVPLVVFTVAPSDLVRFALAALPAAAVLTVWAIAALPGRARWVGTALVAALATVSAGYALARPAPVLEVTDPAAITAPILAGGREVCYVQTSPDGVLSGEHIEFLLRLRQPRLSFAGFDLFAFHVQQYMRLQGCIARGGVIAHRGAAPNPAWPTRAMLAQVVLGADKLALRSGEGLAKGLYPAGFAFEDWAEGPPGERKLTTTVRLDTVAGGPESYLFIFD
jgi:Dolichyl-phosphate-mannose-protein mannosyltransferase